MGKIVDLDGKPFDFDPDLQTAVLDIPQIANRFIEHPASGITPNRAAQCLRAAEQGDLMAQSDLAADIEEKDTHLFAELSKRRLAIQSVPWSILPPSNATAQEKKDAEMLDEYLHGADWFDAMLFDATDAILKGYSCQEIEWGRIGRAFVVNKVIWRDAAHFCLNPQDFSELRLRDGSVEGVPFQPFGWIVHQARSRTGYAGAQGLVRTLVWPFIFKNYSVRDLAEFLEVYGLPMKVGKYPAGATREQKAALMRAVMEIGRRTGEPPARLLAMSEKNLLHADSDKHHDTGVALTADDLALLPSLLARAEAVLWDKVHHNLMYIVTTKDGLAKIVVNAPYGIKRQPDSLDVVINAYRVKKVALEDDIRGGKLEIIEGGL